MRIIRNICNELVNLDSTSASADMPFNLTVPNSAANKWQGTPQPSIPYAMARSKIVNEVLNKLLISATLNGNILTKYAY